MPAPDASALHPGLAGFLPTPDGHRLARRTWLPAGVPRAVVGLVHGYAEHSGRYDALARHLNQHGHAVHAYDQRGHGHSSGRRAYVAAFDDYLDDLHLVLGALRREAAGVPLFLFGHSMGGAVVTLYALERGADVHGLLLSSPALKLPDDLAPLLQRAAAVVGRLLPRLPTLPLDRTALSRDPRVVAQAEQDPLNFHGRLPARTGAELLNATHRIQQQMDALTLPVLLLHGTADRLTDPEGSAALYRQARSTDKSLSLYAGLYHETFNEPERLQVLSEIIDWLDEHTAPDAPDA